MDLKIGIIAILKLLWSLNTLAGELAPFPVFLKQGFSTVLEFDSPPKRIVLGDSQSFQVDRMDKSLVVRSVAPYATGNLFVFFASGEPRVFLLTASEDAEPTLYRKFEEIKPPPQLATPRTRTVRMESARGIALKSARFDSKKDYLTVETVIAADGGRAIRPEWGKARLKYKAQIIPPAKLWAERKAVQKDAKVRARFVFVKPNIPRDFGRAVLVLPVEGEQRSLVVELEERK